MPKESEGPEGSLLPSALMHCQLEASQDASCRWSQSQETLPRPGPFLLDIGRGLRSGVAIWAIVARFQPNYLDFSEAITWPYLTSNSLTAPPQTSSEYKKCASFACPHSSGQFYFVILTYLQWSSYFSRKVASPLCAVLFPTSTKTTFWEMGPVLHLSSGDTPPHQWCKAAGCPVYPATLYLDRREEMAYITQWLPFHLETLHSAHVLLATVSRKVWLCSLSAWSRRWCHALSS